MTISAKANFVSKSSYSVTDSYGNKVNNDSDARTVSLTYAHGTGNKQINNAVTISGTLTSGEQKRFDLYNAGTGILQIIYGITGGIPLNRIKHIAIFNLETTDGANFDVVSTGDDRLTLFSTSVDSSGAQRIRPYSSFSHNDPFTGLAVENESKYIYLHDVAGSGCKFSMLFMGVDESQPTGVASNTSPYF